jgi:predicted Zn-dependent peptidase
MRIHRLFLIGFIIFCSGIGLAAAQPYYFTNPDKLIYPPLQFNPPQAKRMSLYSGMILYMLEDHELPLVNIHIVMRTGSFFDPEGKEGLAELTGAVMKTGGTEIMTGRDIDEELESLAINIDVTTHTESLNIDFSCLKNNLDRGVEILSQIIMHPAFAEDKLRLAKDLKKEELRRIADDPQQFAFREFNRCLYRGDPRGRLPSQRSVEKIVRDDLLQFHKTFFTQDNMMIAGTGDITKKELLDLFAKYFSNRPPAPAKKVEIPPPALALKECMNYLAKDTPQSIIITGQAAPSKKSPDFYNFTVLDYILGSGGFRSYIFQEIRSNQGLAYSAGSFYRPRSNFGIFGTYAMTKAASTGKVLSMLRAIMEKARNHPADLKELDWAKKSINNSFIFSFSSTEKIARQQMMLEFDGLPEDYIYTYQERIKKVGVEDLKRAAKKYLLSEKTITLVAGKEEDFDKPLSTFGRVEKIRINNND